MYEINKDYIFEWSDLHKKLGQLRVSEPTESCIAEGDYMRRVYFIDENMKTYLLFEQDIRKAKPNSTTQSNYQARKKK